MPASPIAAHLFSFILPALQEEEERLRREEERATKRQQKAESAQPAGLEEEQQEEVSTSHPQQQPAASSVDAPSSRQEDEGKDAAKAGDVQQTQQQQQQQQQQQPQAKLQAAAVPAAKLTKAQRQRYIGVSCLMDLLSSFPPWPQPLLYFFRPLLQPPARQGMQEWSKKTALHDDSLHPDLLLPFHPMRHDPTRLYPGCIWGPLLTVSPRCVHHLHNYTAAFGFYSRLFSPAFITPACLLGACLVACILICTPPTSICSSNVVVSMPDHLHPAIHCSHLNTLVPCWQRD